MDSNVFIDKTGSLDTTRDHTQQIRSVKADLPPGPAHEPGGHAEGWVRPDVVRATRQAQVRGVGPYDGDVLREATPQRLDAPRMELDRDDPRAGRDERRGQRARAGPDVEDEIAGPD